MDRETMNFDVLIVGAGPSGLSAAIKLAQLAKDNKKELSICVVEKGSEVGAHILSGAVLEPRALNELIPEWKKKECPIITEAKKDNFLLLTKNKSLKLPTPPQMKNDGNYIISLGNFCRWLAKQAEELGVNIFPGFAATEILFDKDNNVIGIRTGDLGLDKEGKELDNFQKGYDLFSKQTIFAEGCHGSLSKILINKFNLREKSDPQTYGIGLKELWEIKPENHKLGEVIHSVGWPLDNKTYGGSFLYFLENNQVSLGFVIGLDYKNPHLSPFDELQRFKTHPKIKPIFENGKRISYGARALNEGGLQSIPKLTFPGGLMIGCGAGFMNVPKIKGTHTAMKSAMIAAEEIFKNIFNKNTPSEIISYEEELKKSWVWEELYKVRNIRPSFRWGFWPGLIYSAIDTYIFRGKAPWTFKHHEDHKSLEKAEKSKIIDYPKPDGVITFDKLSSVYISNTNHEENQPCHLQIKDEKIPIEHNLENYSSPEQRYCPAGVYEIVKVGETKEPKLQINAQNCVHCKTCDIKDPKQNINWVPPQGGGGPKYPNM